MGGKPHNVRRVRHFAANEVHDGRRAVLSYGEGNVELLSIWIKEIRHAAGIVGSASIHPDRRTLACHIPRNGQVFGSIGTPVEQALVVYGLVTRSPYLDGDIVPRNKIAAEIDCAGIVRGAVPRYRIVGIRDLRANLHGGGIAHAVGKAAVGERPAVREGGRERRRRRHAEQGERRGKRAAHERWSCICCFVE